MELEVAVGLILAGIATVLTILTLITMRLEDRIDRMDAITDQHTDDARQHIEQPSNG